MATVEVSREGELRLHRVDVAFEEGYGLVNPLTVKKQIEGGIAWGYRKFIKPIKMSGLFGG